MKLDAVEEFLDEDLTLPIKGADGTVRDYTIKPCDAGRWLRLAVIRQVQIDIQTKATSAADDLALVATMSQRSMLDDSLGHEVAQAMIDDGVSAQMLQRAAVTATEFHLSGINAARERWSGKGQPSKTPKAKGGDEDDATPKASTSGTSTRRKSSKR